MFVLVAWVMDSSSSRWRPAVLRGLAFILPIVRRSAHPIPVRESRHGRFGFESRNRSSSCPVDCYGRAKPHSTAENIMKLVRFDGGRTGLTVQFASRLDRPEKSTARANAGMNSAWAGLTGYSSSPKGYHACYSCRYSLQQPAMPGESRY